MKAGRSITLVHQLSRVVVERLLCLERSPEVLCDLLPAMDLVLDVCDRHLLTPYVYPAGWSEHRPLRQFISLYVIALVGGWLLYFVFATLSYLFLFDHRLKKHPLFLPNQVRREIVYSSASTPVIVLFTTPIFLLEVRGYSRLYEGVAGVGGWLFCAASVLLFLMFTDFLIYWIHRWLHHRLLYKHIHKGHHTWKVPTPYASHAFHPIDGFLQSIPYHLYTFLFPLHKGVYLFMFVFVNLWTVSIHDGDYRVPGVLQPIINGSAHHTDHHLFYNYNYGQYFTLWDRIGGSFRTPTAFEGKLLVNDVSKQS